ncbi:MAG: DUF3147 family protein [Verrucomicrobiota bacterium]
MAFLFTKFFVSALVIVLVSEIAKRSEKIGALITSLPLIAVMVMIWVYYEKKDLAGISEYAYYTFWYVLPTLPMFLLMAWMLKSGVGFWLSLLSGCLLTIVSFVLTAWIAKKFGVELIS